MQKKYAEQYIDNMLKNMHNFLLNIHNMQKKYATDSKFEQNIQ
jgi:hypothetical protein